MSAVYRLRHPRALEALREDDFTGGLRDPTADGHMLASVGLIPHPTTALFADRHRRVHRLWPGPLGRACAAKLTPTVRLA